MKARTKTYVGRRDRTGTAIVFVIDEHGESTKLALCLNLANHSPTGFEWGYAGSGPAQLALALLVDATGDEQTALRLHQEFKFTVIAKLPRAKPWRLSQQAIITTADKLASRAT